MTRHGLATVLLSLICLILALALSRELEAGQAMRGSGLSCGLGLASVAEAAEWRYSMTVHVRLLLFWISREGVGGARISWREAPDGTRSLQLLIGSDPARAPMRINRWGYIAEHVDGSSAELIGVMTQSDERSIEQARQNLSRSGGAHAFKAIRGRVTQGEALSTVIHLLLAEEFTYRDVNVLLGRLPQAGFPVRRISVPKGVEPGFLFALKNLVHQSVESYHRSGRVDTGCKSPRLFVYHASLYELAQRSSDIIPKLTVGGRDYHEVIESRLDVRNRATGETTGFGITYGTRGAAAEIPLRIVYRPRWWFEAELILDGPDDSIRAIAEGAPWKAGYK